MMVSNEDFSADWLDKNLAAALTSAEKYQAKSVGSNAKAAMRIAELAQEILLGK